MSKEESSNKRGEKGEGKSHRTRKENEFTQWGQGATGERASAGQGEEKRQKKRRHWGGTVGKGQGRSTWGKKEDGQGDSTV